MTEYKYLVIKIFFFEGFMEYWLVFFLLSDLYMK